MRIACCQWTPVFMDPDASRQQADKLLEAAYAHAASRGRSRRWSKSHLNTMAEGSAHGPGVGNCMTSTCFCCPKWPLQVTTGRETARSNAWDRGLTMCHCVRLHGMRRLHVSKPGRDCTVRRGRLHRPHRRVGAALGCVPRRDVNGGSEKRRMLTRQRASRPVLGRRTARRLRAYVLVGFPQVVQGKADVRSAPHGRTSSSAPVPHACWPRGMQRTARRATTTRCWW